MLARVMDPGVEWTGQERRDFGQVLFVALTVLFFMTASAIAFPDPPSPEQFEATIQAGL